MTTSRLYNVRDLFWKMESGGTGYLTNANNELPSRDNFIGYNTSIAASGSPYEDDYIKFHGTDTNQKYHFRSTHEKIVPTDLSVNMHASNIDAKIYVNDIEVGTIGSFGDVPETILTNFQLTSAQRSGVLKNRHQPYYDFFSIESLNSPVGSGGSLVGGLTLDSIVPGALSGGDNNGTISVTNTVTPSTGIYNGENFTIKMTLNNLANSTINSTIVQDVPNITLSTNPAYPFDLVYVSSNPVATTINDQYWAWPFWSMASGESRTYDLTLQISETGVPIAENQSTVFETKVARYVSQLVKFDTITDYSGGTSNPSAIYGFELELSNLDNKTYENYISDPGGISTTRLYPTGVFTNNSIWKNHNEAAISVDSINVATTGVDSNNAFIYALDEAGLHNTLPSGYLSLGFDTSNLLNQDSTVTRATLSCNLSLPESSSISNYRDVIDFINIPKADRDLLLPTSFLWGKSNIVEQSGFLTYTNDLSFMDLDLLTNPALSGDASSRRHAYIKSFNNLELGLVGVPTSTRLSAVHIDLEYYPSNNISLLINGIETVQNNESLFLHGHDVFPSTYDYDTGEYIGLWFVEEYNFPQTFYISGGPNTTETTLYTFGAYNINNNLTLSMSGIVTQEENNRPLFIWGHDIASSFNNVFNGEFDDIFDDIYGSGYVFPLTITGQETITSTIPLTLTGLIPGTGINNLDLRIKGSNEPEISSVSQLFLKSYDFDPIDSIPMFIENGAINDSYDQLKLVIGNSISSFNDLNIFIKNDVTEINEGRRLFMKSSYYYRDNDSLNLHIERNQDSIAHVQTMYLKATEEDNYELPLIIKGVFVANSLYEEYLTEEYIGVWFIDDSDYTFTMYISGNPVNTTVTQDLFTTGF